MQIVRGLTPETEVRLLCSWARATTRSVPKSPWVCATLSEQDNRRSEATSEVAREPIDRRLVPVASSRLSTSSVDHVEDFLADKPIGVRRRSTGPQDELEAGRMVPFAQLPVWVALSGVSATAQALYWQLSLHLNTARDDRVVFPSRATLAARLGFTQARTVDRYITELIKVGAVTKYHRTSEGGWRASNTYVLHQLPPAGYRGPLSLADLRPRATVTSLRDRFPDPQSPDPSSEPPEPERTVPEHDDHPATTSAGEKLLRSLPTLTRLVGETTLLRLVPLVDQALANGWVAEDLARELTVDLEGARSPGGVVMYRLTHLPAHPPPPADPAQPPPPVCRLHPGSARRADGQCAGCWADAQA